MGESRHFVPRYLCAIHLSPHVQYRPNISVICISWIVPGYSDHVVTTSRQRIGIKDGRAISKGDQAKREPKHPAAVFRISDSSLSPDLMFCSPVHLLLIQIHHSESCLKDCVYLIQVSSFVDLDDKSGSFNRKRNNK